ncbi:hypothetical protein E2F48_16115 [Arthrobacter crusticola]|uniref:Uncharacterized protein n=1 Tax=Arthrobacter crusticola TaxID=2547960 RepID=A0A4R5TNG9_9MICC|nr:hypothetical protein [Arthrobacter crusticola]TDK23514.1 hypothetical protein E2F48_16115 [Arthrobacter crusticola]
MPASRKRVSDDVMTRVSKAIDALAADQSAPRTKRQIEILSGLGHDAVARAFRQDAAESDNPHRLNEKLNRLIAPLGTSRRSPAAEEKYQDKQKIVELKQQVSELNRQLDRYAMTLFAVYLADNPSAEASRAVSIRRHRQQRH